MLKKIQYSAQSEDLLRTLVFPNGEGEECNRLACMVRLAEIDARGLT